MDIMNCTKAYEITQSPEIPGKSSNSATKMCSTQPAI
jgi:hypothetical protein